MKTSMKTLIAFIAVRCASAFHVNHWTPHSCCSSNKVTATWIGHIKTPAATSSREQERRLKKSLLQHGSAVSRAASVAEEDSGDGLLSPPRLDYGLLLLFCLWFAGNYYYKVTNRLMLVYSGGRSGFPMTLACLQLGVGSIYALLTWLPPTASRPRVTAKDLVKMIPVSLCFMGAHSASLFAFSAGAVSFAEIVKAAEPTFAAVLSQFAYGRQISRAKWLCLPIIIGGVIMASAKELTFTWYAVLTGCIANMFAAIRGNENKKLLDDKSGVKSRIGSVGNQFALTTILAFFLSIPLAILKEGSQLPESVRMIRATPSIWKNMVYSSLWYYGYNECSTRTLKKTGAVTQSVANTAKRVLVILGAALRFGESVAPIKMIGSTICIGGVFLYSVVDSLMPSSSSSKSPTAPNS